MADLFAVLAPVFLVIGAGYGATRFRLFDPAGTDHIMRFAQNFAIPCLLFLAIARLDLAQSFAPNLLISYYSSALSGFLIGLLAARYVFGRAREDAVAIGFCALFANSVLVGLPITERAFGTATLAGNFAIIAVHAPICYGVGTITMELLRRSTGAPRSREILKGLLGNPLILGIAAGFIVNMTGLPLPPTVWDGISLLASAGIPAALFGLGSVLTKYPLAGDLRIVAMICVIALIVRPLGVWGVGSALGLDENAFRSAVLTGAMPPGVNVYLFAFFYGRAMRIAAATVFIGTCLSFVTISVWLALLG